MKTIHYPARIIRHLLFGWLLAVTTEFLLLPGAFRALEDLSGLTRMSLPRVAAVTAGAAALSFAAERLGAPAGLQRWGIAGAFAALAFAALRASFTWAFLGACILVFGVLAVYAVRGWDSRPEPASGAARAGKVSIGITLGLTLLFFLFVCAWGLGRYFSFSTPTYDFGIFSQMFYYLKETGLPMTTVERDGLLSHFAVHVSPVYYLMLPFYWLAPSPATLQVLQAAVLTSSVIPLWKLGRHHGLTGTQRALLTAVLLLYPALSGGTGYDIHENCFLTPVLLWLFYGIDRENTFITALSALLCLGVKEDAPVYVAVIALWLTVRALLRHPENGRKQLITGLTMLALSLGWFFLVTGYLARSGDGVMTYRYQNFLYGGSSSLLTVVKAVLLHPMKAIYECMDREKLPFLALTLLPLLGLPLWTRRYERYLLLIPYILVNLMPDYQYQHDIFFQYTFGSTACLMYLTIVNLEDLKGICLLPLIGAAVISALCFGGAVLPRAVQYPVRCVRYHEEYAAIRSALSRIPQGASVSATTFHTAFLSQRETLYDLRYSSEAHILETEYIVLSLPGTNEYQKYADDGKENGYENLISLLEEKGYAPFCEVEDRLVIYRKTT